MSDQKDVVGTILSRMLDDIKSGNVMLYDDFDPSPGDFYLFDKDVVVHRSLILSGSGSYSFARNLIIIGDLLVRGSATISVNGAMVIGGRCELSGACNIRTNTVTRGKFKVSGTATINGDILSEDFLVTGMARHYGKFIVIESTTRSTISTSLDDIIIEAKKFGWKETPSETDLGVKIKKARVVKRENARATICQS